MPFSKLFGDALDDLGKLGANFADRKQRESLIITFMLMGWADGDCDDQELQQGYSVLFALLPDSDTDKVEKDVMSIQSVFETKGVQIASLTYLTKLAQLAKGKDWALSLLDAAEQISKASEGGAESDKKEQEMFNKIAQYLNLTTRTI
jgi:tellurite resistance protein